MWALMHFSTPWKHDLPICFSKPLVCTSLRPRNRCMNFKPLYRKTIPWNHLFNGPQLTPESLEGIENLNMFRHNLKHFDLSQFEYCDKELLLTAVYCKPTLFCSIVLELERGLHFFPHLIFFIEEFLWRFMECTLAPQLLQEIISPSISLRGTC